MKVAILFARRGSIYNQIGGCDVWDEVRDARRYGGALPVVAHPPCRGWGRLRHMAKIAPGELDLARGAVAQVRRCGGVLEHPEASKLWADMSLPIPGRGRDEMGGWSISIDQIDFGHRARKRTWLYIVGLAPNRLPTWALSLAPPSHRVELMGRGEREATPQAFAEWLVTVARQTA